MPKYWFYTHVIVALNDIIDSQLEFEWQSKEYMNRNEKRTCTVSRSRVGKSYGNSPQAGSDHRRSPEIFIGA